MITSQRPGDIMEYFVEQGTTHRDALEKVRAKYGDQAKVMHQRTIRMGGFLGLFSREGVELTGYLSKEPSTRSRKPSDPEEEKRKILGQVKTNNDRTLETLVKEVQGLKSQLQEGAYASAPVEQEHESVAHVRELLERNEFTPSYIREILARLKREFAIDELDELEMVEQRVVEWIGESISLYDYENEPRKHTFVLVGPTGVGKTTTIAKLAAMWGLGSRGLSAHDVRILTIDNYRIGARHQIETYGEIMGIPVHCAESYADLEKQMALYRDVDLVFVDTIGKSPKDSRKIGEMREELEACGRNSSVHLAVSSTTKASDLETIMQQFEPFAYRSVVATKLDETSCVGPLISTLHAKNKPLSYITDGQQVPVDIHRADVVSVLLRLDGFRIQRERLENRFATQNTRA